jgi:hypothetical protein
MAAKFGPDGLTVPQMTTSERDAISSPEIGQFIYNTSTNQYEIYSGSSWNAINF